MVGSRRVQLHLFRDAKRRIRSKQWREFRQLPKHEDYVTTVNTAGWGWENLFRLKYLRTRSLTRFVQIKETEKDQLEVKDDANEVRILKQKMTWSLHFSKPYEAAELIE